MENGSIKNLNIAKYLYNKDGNSGDEIQERIAKGRRTLFPYFWKKITRKKTCQKINSSKHYVVCSGSMELEEKYKKKLFYFDYWYFQNS